MTQNNSLGERFDYAQLHDLLTGARDAEHAVRALSEFIGGIHVTYHHVQSRIGEVDAPYVRTTYPAEWVSKYLMRGYVEIDPVIQAGLQRQLPFEWSELETTPEAIAMMMDALSHGLGTFGFSVPIVDASSRRGLFSINSKLDQIEWSSFMEASRDHMIEAAHMVHRLAVQEIYGDEEIPTLSPREREVLMWTARGKDCKTVALIIGVSDHTAKGYLKTIRFKLGCSTIAQAVAKALMLRIISD